MFFMSLDTEENSGLDFRYKLISNIKNVCSGRGRYDTDNFTICNPAMGLHCTQ